MKMAVISVGVLLSGYVLSKEFPELNRDYLEQYINEPFDKEEMMHKSIILGMYNGTKVVAEHPCSDLCPSYTIRVVRFDVSLDGCDRVGGIKKEFEVPIRTTLITKEYCVPSFKKYHDGAGATTEK